MEYRTLGRSGMAVSAIGLGTEHLEIDSESMDEVLRTGVEAGLDFVDLLYVDAAGIDARFWEHFGPALRRYRGSLILQAHWNRPPNYEIDHCRQCFEDVLARVGNSFVEIGLIGMVDDDDQWSGWAQESIQHLKRYQEEGRVGYIGMSSHRAPVALEAVKSGLIDVLMFQVNAIRTGYYEGQRALYQECVERDVGLVAMKPYFGGTLLTLDGKPTGITPVQCLSRVLSLPVSTTVPGAKNAEELRAALHYFEATDEEKNLEPLADQIKQSLAGHCVYCNHCLPCPEGINIGRTLLIADWARGMGISEELSGFYADLEVKPTECTECGVCMDRCPFHVDVIAKIAEAAEVFRDEPSSRC
jgi:predicted aldo/keto reductase-like oxidoreductase